jgi:glycosyltransferase involved in cell wall biosynthesis
MICVSNAEYDYLAGAVGPRSAEARALVIHNGVQMPPPPTAGARAEVRRELGLTESEPVGIWVGSLDERKDPLIAVRAAEQAGVALLVVGDGPLRAQAERLASGNVRVLGQRTDVTRLLNAADLYVLTSSREGFAFSLLEAMAHGLPAIVSDIRENTEAVGDSGAKYPLGDEDALVDAWVRLVRLDNERLSHGVRARQRVAEQFNADQMATRTSDVYRRVISPDDSARVQRMPRRSPKA